MSRAVAGRAATRMNLRDVLFFPRHLDSMIADLHQLANCSPEQEQARQEQANLELLQAYGFQPNQQTPRKPFVYANGVAIIPVHGSLINRFGSSYSFLTGYNFIRNQLNAAMGDTDVKGVIMDIHSNGGEVAGCFELVDDIYAARAKKPILGVIDSNCYSAAYAIGSACTKLACTPSGGVGSIGVVAAHISMEKFLDAIGWKITLIYSGKHKVDGNPFEDLPKEVHDEIQASVNSTRNTFAATTGRNRNKSTEDMLATEAKTYRADDALKIGLIDSVATPGQAVSAFMNELTSSSPQESGEMTTQATTATPAVGAPAPAVAPAAQVPSAADAQKAERARISAIMNSEEGKKNPNLANHFAYETDMSAESAVAALKASVPAAPAPVATQTVPAAAATAPQVNQFKQAMDADTHPNLSAADNGGEQGADLGAGISGNKGADLILGSLSIATGRDYAKKAKA
jgi:signal peptide peptidase SppA